MMNPLDILSRQSLMDAFKDIIHTVLDNYMDLQHKKVQRIDSGIQLNIQEGYVYLVENHGVVSVYGAERQLLYMTSSSVLVGLVSMFGFRPEVTALKFLKSVPVYFMRSEDFLEIITARNLWLPLGRIFSHYIYELTNIYKRTSYRTCSDIVRELVSEYYSLNEEVRNNINLSKYIISRSKISRSSVFNILSEIYKDGFMV